MTRQEASDALIGKAGAALMQYGLDLAARGVSIEVIAVAIQKYAADDMAPWYRTAMARVYAVIDRHGAQLH